MGEAEQRIPGVHANMKQYITDGILREAVTNGFILTERTTEAGARRGLVGAVDLEAYSFEKNAGALVRPTEETIRSRLPARMVIRQDAPLELTHILILVDDPDDKLIGTLYNKRNELESLYARRRSHKGLGS